MNNHNLTTLEKRVILAFCTNYSSAEAEKNDNATYSDVFELADRADLYRDTVKGVCGSLVKKGLIAIDPPRNGAGQCFYLTDDGIDVYYSLK